eukprot:m.130864 g.130864  ORF g.130864 m.130864 type:complete len:153 (-) comp11295_c0_seq1:3407-3865(-)
MWYSMMLVDTLAVACPQRVHQAIGRRSQFSLQPVRMVSCKAKHGDTTQVPVMDSDIGVVGCRVAPHAVSPTVGLVCLQHLDMHGSEVLLRRNDQGDGKGDRKRDKETEKKKRRHKRGHMEKGSKYTVKQGADPGAALDSLLLGCSGDTTGTL